MFGWVVLEWYCLGSTWKQYSKDPVIFLFLCLQLPYTRLEGGPCLLEGLDSQGRVTGRADRMHPGACQLQGMKSRGNHQQAS